MLGHDPGTFSQDDPGKQTANDSIAHPDPGSGHTVIPAKLTGIADEYHCGKIGSTVCKSGEPGAGCSAAQNKVADGFGFPTGVKTDSEHDNDVNNNHPDCTSECHEKNLLFCFKQLRFKLRKLL